MSTHDDGLAWALRLMIRRLCAPTMTHEQRVAELRRMRDERGGA